MAALFTIFSARLIDLQVSRHAKYARVAAQRNTIQQVIPARRGLIKDRNGAVLAYNVPMRTVILDGTHVNNAPALAALAAPVLQMDEKELEAKLVTDRKYVVLKRKVPEPDAFALRRAMQEKNLRGLYFDPDASRAYVNNSMLCHLIGFLNREGEGVQGIEMSMDSWLRGQDGFRFIERDGTGRELVMYRGQEQEARDGHDVYLTIDMGLQMIVEEELDAAVAELKPETAVVVMVRPKTGEILAMASRPGFNPNDLSDTKPEQMKNRAIIDMVEPGSIFKIVVASGALNEGVASLATRVFCENGRFFYGGRTLKDHHGYGSLGVHDILVKSSNIGSAKLALMMGDQKFYEYVRRFGFGDRTGVDLPGEIRGLVNPPHLWDKLTITRMPMGHSVSVTPLQMTMAMGVVANGGKLMKPHIVSRITETSGTPVVEYKPEVVREVIRPEVAAMVNDALVEVVSERGTARRAAVDGYTGAGKTGTAQKLNPKGGYLDGKYVVSFLGYAPAENPEIVTLVMIDNAALPPSANYGGLVSAPIFSRIVGRAARHLDIPKSQVNGTTVAFNASPTGGDHADR